MANQQQWNNQINGSWQTMDSSPSIDDMRTSQDEKQNALGKKIGIAGILIDIVLIALVAFLVVSFLSSNGSGLLPSGGSQSANAEQSSSSDSGSDTQSANASASQGAEQNGTQNGE